MTKPPIAKPAQTKTARNFLTCKTVHVDVQNGPSQGQNGPMDPELIEVLIWE